MAVVNANCLAIYYDSVNSQSKAKVYAPYATASDVENEFTTLTADRILIADDDTTSGENNIFVEYGEMSNGGFSSRLTDLVLVGAATSSTLDLTNAVEVVARDGEGGTLQESTQDWSLSADGLIQVDDDAGVDLLDLARNKYYVIVKFSVDKNGTTTDYYGQVLLDSVSLSGGVDEIATYSVSMTGVDALLKQA